VRCEGHMLSHANVLHAVSAPRWTNVVCHAPGCVLRAHLPRCQVWGTAHAGKWARAFDTTASVLEAVLDCDGHRALCSPVRVHMWQAGVSPVLVQMWQGSSH
jgi:hypothetical protein